MSPLPRQGWLFLIEFLKWYFSKYWQVRTRPVFAQTVTINKCQPEEMVWFTRLVGFHTSGHNIGMATKLKCVIFCTIP